MGNVTLSRAELLCFAKSNLAFYGLDLDRLSTIFIAQVYQLGINRTLNIFSIMDEVKWLEGIKQSTSTGNESQFRGNVLAGLYKKHFTDARFILKNILVYLNYKKGNENRFDNIIKQYFENKTSVYVDDKLINSIAHDITIGAYQNRAKSNLTGEWVVFKKYNGKNYYLTLAAHDEGDENIKRRVESAYEVDFPFLKIV